MPRMRPATRSGSKVSSASIFSPRPTNLIGLPVTARMESAAPPRPSPSIRVSTTPVMPTRPRTRSRHRPRPGRSGHRPPAGSRAASPRRGPAPPRPSAPRRSAAGRRCRACRRRSRPSTAWVLARRAISTADWPLTIGRVSTPIWRPRISSCSIAAGRLVSSEAISTRLPSRSFSRLASLAVVVVLPPPCRPTIRIGAGGLSIFSVARLRVVAGQHMDQLVMDDLDHLLARGDRPGHRLAGGLVLHRLHEVAGDGQRDVGLQKRHPDLAQRGRDIGIAQRALLGQPVEDAARAVRTDFRTSRWLLRLRVHLTGTIVSRPPNAQRHRGRNALTDVDPLMVGDRKLVRTSGIAARSSPGRAWSQGNDRRERALVPETKASRATGEASDRRPGRTLRQSAGGTRSGRAGARRTCPRLREAKASGQASG